MQIIDAALKDTKIVKGDFQKRAAMSQSIKSTMRWQENWEKISDDKKEALEGIADKLSNILCGEANCRKYWESIIGYSRLIIDNIDNMDGTNDNMEMISVRK